jgi:hypothetical protein
MRFFRSSKILIMSVGAACLPSMVLAISEAEHAALMADDVCLTGQGNNCALNALQSFKGPPKVSDSALLQEAASWPTMPDVGDLTAQAQEAAQNLQDQATSKLNEFTASANEAASKLKNMDNQLAAAANEAVSNATKQLQSTVANAADQFNPDEFINQVSVQTKDALHSVQASGISELEDLNKTVADMAASIGVTIAPIPESATQNLKDYEAELQKQLDEISVQAKQVADSSEAAAKERILADINKLNSTVSDGISKVESAVDEAEKDVQTRLDSATDSLPESVRGDVKRAIQEGVIEGGTQARSSTSPVAITSSILSAIAMLTFSGA